MIISPYYRASTLLAWSLFILSSQQYYLIITLASFRLQITYYPRATTLLLPPHYKLTNSSHRAPSATPFFTPTDNNLSYSAPALIPEPFLCFILPDFTTASSPDTTQPTISTPAPAPYTNPANLPLPTITTTPSVTDYPDLLTSHDTARTLARRCLRETSSPNLNPDVIPEMERALATAIDQLQ